MHAKERIGGKTEVDVNGHDIHAVRLNELDATQDFFFHHGERDSKMGSPMPLHD